MEASITDSGTIFYCKGRTAICASISGPTDAKFYDSVRVSTLLSQPQLIVEFIPKCSSQKTFAVDIGERVSNCLQGVLQAYDRQIINITLFEVQNDGCLLATCINASMLALMKAGFTLSSTIGALSFIYRDNSFVEPGSKDDENNSAVKVDIALDLSTKRVVMLHCLGSTDAFMLEQCVDTANTFTESLRRNISNSIQMQVQR